MIQLRTSKALRLVFTLTLFFNFYNLFAQEQVIDTLKNDIPTLFLKYQDLVNQKKFSDANSTLDEALLIEPNSPFLYLYKAKIYLNIGNEAYALDNLEKSYYLDNEIYEVNYYLSVLYYNKIVMLQKRLKSNVLNKNRKAFLQKQKKQLALKMLPNAEKSYFEAPNKESKEILKQTYNYLNMTEKLKDLMSN